MFVSKKEITCIILVFLDQINYLSASAVLHNEPFSHGPTRCTKCLIKKKKKKFNLKKLSEKKENVRCWWRLMSAICPYGI